MQTTLDSELSTDIARDVLRASSDPSIVIVDGSDVRVCVRSGQLQIIDGLNREQRTRIISKADRDIRRIVIFTEHGFVTLDAIRFCESQGIAVTQLDRDMKLIMSSCSVFVSPKLRQMQTIVSAGYLPHVRLETTRTLLSAKLSGQASIAGDILSRPDIAASITERCRYIDKANDVSAMLGFEGNAARDYWKAWSSVSVRWNRTKNLPGHWLEPFRGRASGTQNTIVPANRNRSFSEPESGNRAATDPINAMLNYVYTVATSETMFSCLVHGLDPDMGFTHVVKSDRHAMALDFLETVRPACDRVILSILSSTIDRGWFYEDSYGVVPIMPSLTHIICEQSLTFARLIEPYVKELVSNLKAVSPVDEPILQRNAG